MSTTRTATAVNVTLRPPNGQGRIPVVIDGIEAGTIRDGRGIIRSADRFLLGRKIYRETGFTLGRTGLVARAHRLEEVEEEGPAEGSIDEALARPVPNLV